MHAHTHISYCPNQPCHLRSNSFGVGRNANQQAVEMLKSKTEYGRDCSW